MNWYFLPLLCLSCGGQLDLRQFQYQSDGTIQLKTWCPNCRRDRFVPVDMKNLAKLASVHESKKFESFPGPADRLWLHELCVSWDTAKQLPSQN